MGQRPSHMLQPPHFLEPLTEEHSKWLTTDMPRAVTDLRQSVVNHPRFSTLSGGTKLCIAAMDFSRCTQRNNKCLRFIWKSLYHNVPYEEASYKVHGCYKETERDQGEYYFERQEL